MHRWLKVLADIRPGFITVRLYNMHETSPIHISDLRSFFKTRYNIKSRFDVRKTSLDANSNLEPVVGEDGLQSLTLRPTFMSTFAIVVDK